MTSATPKRGSAEERRWFKAVAGLETCVLCGAHGIQIAHRNAGKGMGMKTAPWMTAALCPACHTQLDSSKNMDKMERRYWLDCAIVRTHDRLIREGVLKLESR